MERGLLFSTAIFATGAVYAGIFAVLTAVFGSSHTDPLPLMLLICVAYVATFPWIYMFFHDSYRSEHAEHLQNVPHGTQHATDRISEGKCYVQQLRADGFSDEKIYAEFVRAGWQDEQIKHILADSDGVSNRKDVA